MKSANENQTVSEWVNAMLAKCEFNKPSGRQLYQYRLAAAEFGESEDY